MSTCSLAAAIKPSARSLCVIFASAFTVREQVRTLVKPCFFHLGVNSKIRRLLTILDLEKGDSCFYHLWIGLLRFATFRQNALTQLTLLHWLLVYICIHFKMSLMTYKGLHGLEPPCVSECVIPFHQSHCLKPEG